MGTIVDTSKFYRHFDNIYPSNSKNGLKLHRGDGPNVNLRMLIAARNARAIIGKGGETIKRLRSEYGAQLQIADSDTPERVVTISSALGTVCEVLMEIIPKLEEYQEKKDLNFDCDLKFLVHQSQCGPIIGKGGAKVKELKVETGANLNAYQTCAPMSSERVVQLMGKPQQCVNCIASIMELLQNIQPKGFSAPYDTYNYDEFMVEEYGGYYPGRGRGGRGGGRGGGARGAGARGGGFGGRGSFNGSGYGGGRGGGRGGKFDAGYGSAGYGGYGGAGYGTMGGYAAGGYGDGGYGGYGGYGRY